MYCPYCGSEILDNSNFCPDCGEAIKREKLIPEEKPIYSEREKIYYDWLYNFFQENQGKAFTIKSLENRLDPMNEKALGSLLQNILNKMRDRKIIGSALQDGETHYYFSDYKEPEIFDSGQEKQISLKTSEGDNTALILVAVIGSIIGFILIIAAIPTIIRGSPSAGITMIVIGIIVITIVSRGRCFFCFYGCEGCGDCDCDCDC
jgi:hypothetical protein